MYVRNVLLFGEKNSQRYFALIGLFIILYGCLSCLFAYYIFVVFCFCLRLACKKTPMRSLYAHG